MLYVLYAFLAGLMVWLLTIGGSTLVLIIKDRHHLWVKIMTAFSSGMILAAVSFSLIIPGVLEARDQGQNPRLVIPLGILIGGGF